MPRDYIPARDADLVPWSENFNTVISTGYASYGLSSGQATAFDTLNTAWAAAYALAVDPGTRTPVTVAAKDTAKATLVATARQYGQIARKYPGITDELLADAGLTVPDPIPSPIPAPTTVPVLSLLTGNSLQDVLRFRDSVLSNPRSKPPGVVGMLLYAYAGVTPPSSFADYNFVGMKTRMPATVDWAGGSGGKSAYYIGQWVNAKGQVGPNSTPFVHTIAA